MEFVGLHPDRVCEKQDLPFIPANLPSEVSIVCERLGRRPYRDRIIFEADAFREIDVFVVF